MSSNTIGILIIVAIVAIGIMTNGEIFTGNVQNRSATEIEYSNMYSTDETGSTPEERNSAIYRELLKAEEQARLLKIEVEKAVENQNASQYKNKVEISYVVGRGTFNSYIRLSAGSSLLEPINISGWKLRSTVTGSEQTIGGAAEIPYPNSYSVEKPILISRGAAVVVSSAQSPIGISFRVNKCTGYLTQYTVFTPSLSRNCPAPNENAPALSSNFNGACLDYIDSLSSCEIPQENEFPENLTFACRQYLLTQVNYNNCVALHQRDSDFYRPEWRVHPPISRLLWLEDRESIQLIDSAGKIVDTYTY